MKTRKNLRMVMQSAALILICFLSTPEAHAKGIKATNNPPKRQTSTYLGDFQETVGGVETLFAVYGDSSTMHITEIDDVTDGVGTTLTSSVWGFYYYGTNKVEFSVTINGTVYHLLYEGTFFF